MPVAFVLINITPIHEHQVYNALSRIKEISELHALFGNYDVLAKIETSTMEEIGSLVINKIRSVEGVIDTKTLTGTKF